MEKSSFLGHKCSGSLKDNEYQVRIFRYRNCINNDSYLETLSKGPEDVEEVL